MRPEHLLSVAKITAAICGVLLLPVVAWLLRLPLALCFLSLALAAALAPVIDALTKAKLPRWAAMGAVYFAVAAVLVTLPILLFTPLASEFSDFAEHLSTAVQSEPDPSQPAGRLQAWLLTVLPQLRDLAAERLGDGQTATFWQVLGFTWGAFEALGNLLVVLVLSLYWSSDGDRFERLWLSLLSVERRAAARDLWQTIQAEIGAYLRSEAVQCFLAGTLLWAGARLIGFPYPILLATIGGVAWLIPWAGWVIVVTATVVLSIPTVVQSGDHAVWTVVFPVALYALAILAVLEYWIEPKFFDRRHYNALLILLMVIVLTELFGVTGLLLGPPIAATLQLVGGHVIRRRTAANITPDDDGRWRERLDQVWQTANSQENPAPELISILERLSGLAGGAKWLSGAANWIG